MNNLKGLRIRVHQCDMEPYEATVLEWFHGAKAMWAPNTTTYLVLRAEIEKATPTLVVLDYHEAYIEIVDPQLDSTTRVCGVCRFPYTPQSGCACAGPSNRAF